MIKVTINLVDMECFGHGRLTVIKTCFRKTPKVNFRNYANSGMGTSYLIDKEKKIVFIVILLVNGKMLVG